MAKTQAAVPDLGDFTKLFGQFQVPGVDWHELLAAQQKNMEALTRANQLLVQGAQAVMQREVEIMQRALTEVASASQDLMKEGDPQANATKRLELARTSFETALQNMRELAEMASTSQREALDVINQRALESFDEVKAAVDKKRAGAKP